MTLRQLHYAIFSAALIRKHSGNYKRLSRATGRPTQHSRHWSWRTAVDIEEVEDKLLEECVAVRLDREGKLRIDKHASPELKALARAHKEELIEIQRAQAIMNRPGMRSIRLPLG